MPAVTEPPGLLMYKVIGPFDSLRWTRTADANAFAVASVCVSRAGSNTLFELMSLKIPCVLIPLPKGASRGDQIYNAEYFQKLGLANVLPQSVLTPESLTLAIHSAYANRNNIKKNIQILCKQYYVDLAFRKKGDPSKRGLPYRHRFPQQPF